MTDQLKALIEEMEFRIEDFKHEINKENHLEDYFKGMRNEAVFIIEKLKLILKEEK